MNRNFALLIVACAILVLLTTSCATQNTPAQTAAPAVTQTTIPSDCPLSKIRVGMGLKEITDLIGEPTDRRDYVSSKSLIPLYGMLAQDTVQRDLYYKGMGRINMSCGTTGGNPTVKEIIYDPNETGYQR